MSEIILMGGKTQVNRPNDFMIVVTFKVISKEDSY